VNESRVVHRRSTAPPPAGETSRPELEKKERSLVVSAKDVLFANTPQTAFGVGVAGGSRGGGGPGIFFEWSSDD